MNDHPSPDTEGSPPPGPLMTPPDGELPEPLLSNKGLPRPDTAEELSEAEAELFDTAKPPGYDEEE